jgi:predicted PurR-regulated permease PerM
MKERRLLSIVLALILLNLLVAPAFAAGNTITSEGVTIIFETATDEELEEAAEAIHQEQQRRLKTRIVLSTNEIKLAKGAKATIGAVVEDIPDDQKASAFSIKVLTPSVKLILKLGTIP